MKTIVVILTLLLPVTLSAQTGCKVLFADLDSVYEGKCKNGLAHGAGKAWGKFFYEGRFSAGYPDGQGRAEYPDGNVYVGNWKKGLRDGKGTLYLKSGGKTVEKTWIWQDGVMIREVVPPAYRVITQRNIGRLRVYKQGEGNYVWFYPISEGGVSTDFMDMQMTGSSGSEVIFKPKLGYQDVRFPFKGSIRYKAWNKMRTAEYEILLELEITEPGVWIVEVQN
jgi:hypothetical protein